MGAPPAKEFGEGIVQLKGARRRYVARVTLPRVCSTRERRTQSEDKAREYRQRSNKATGARTEDGTAQALQELGDTKP